MSMTPRGRGLFQYQVYSYSQSIGRKEPHSLRGSARTFDVVVEGTIFRSSARPPDLTVVDRFIS